MTVLTNKHILVGITGGIAAYKIAELVRELKRQGAEVKVMMTAISEQFITPTTLQALSGNPVYTHEWLNSPNAAMDHIELARWADLILIAPASADSIARIAHGHANDLLTTTCLATIAPVLIAPAMNQRMWQNPFVQANITRLQQNAIEIIPPETGEQACGDIGPGRLPDIFSLVNIITAKLTKQHLSHQRVIITAGGTHEAIDPVRYIANRSSGKMGYALAQAAVEAGADVTLISGPSALTPPIHTHFIPVISAEDMLEAVMQQINLAACNIFISAAAVSDYRPSKPHPHKIKKQTSLQNLQNPNQVQASWNLNLIPNPDILATVATLPFKSRPFVVGFAAETENLLGNAKQKLIYKNLDLIIANQVGNDQGFEADCNAVIVLDKHNQISEFEKMPKNILARKLIALIYQQYSHSQKITDHGQMIDY